MGRRTAIDWTLKFNFNIIIFKFTEAANRKYVKVFQYGLAQGFTLTPKSCMEASSHNSLCMKASNM